MAIKTRVIRNRPILRHVLDTCITQLWEEVPAGEVVTAGMFFVNKHPAIVLFDSGASHSFMSQAFASMYDQKIIEVDKGWL